jgi:hypothetical protein
VQPCSSSPVSHKHTQYQEEGAVALKCQHQSAKPHDSHNNTNTINPLVPELFFKFLQTLYLIKVNNTGTKRGRIMKLTAL